MNNTSSALLIKRVIKAWYHLILNHAHGCLLINTRLRLPCFQQRLRVSVAIKNENHPYSNYKQIISAVVPIIRLHGIECVAFFKIIYQLCHLVTAAFYLNSSCAHDNFNIMCDYNLYIMISFRYKFRATLGKSSNFDRNIFTLVYPIRMLWFHLWPLLLIWFNFNPSMDK